MKITKNKLRLAAIFFNKLMALEPQISLAPEFGKKYLIKKLWQATLTANFPKKEYPKQVRKLLNAIGAFEKID